MKLSTLWLREWVHFSLSEKGLADQLTMAGLEVDSLSPVAGEFSQVIVAEVVGTKPHPDADKLTCCDVSIGNEKTLKIVCGASNVRPGLKVALAMIGAILPSGLKIKESKLRGELSQGMLCSLSELGMAEQSEGIMELESDAPVGMDLREYLGLDDHVLDVNLTPNRADCLSVLGIAREVAVLNNLPLNEPSVISVPPEIDDILPVQIQNAAACPRYCGRIIRDINLGAQTPLWLSERLRRGGVRAVHPVVDIMNYVMMELGQPMHAFDLNQVQGEINVRFGRGKEQLKLLDGQDVVLSDNVLVIADKEKPLAIAGIMGGEVSAVSELTRDLFLESAYFNPITIAGVARKHGLFTDSSQRYERGVDPYLQMKALERATALILSIVGGQPGPVIESSAIEHLPATITLDFETRKVSQLTGLSVPVDEVKRLLEGLGLSILGQSGDRLKVQVPSHRVDIQLDVDLVEEVIRLHGYDKLRAAPISIQAQVGVTCANESIATVLTQWFRNKGYHETITYSFVDPELQEALYPEKHCMQLLNPISSELSQMRVGMWPGLIASMIYNVHRQQSSIRFFEIGVVFDFQEKALVERPCVAGLLMGEQGGLNWSERPRVFDFFDLKGDLQALLSQLKLECVEFRSGVHTALHPGQSAQIIINGVASGWIGVLHPRLAEALDAPHDVILFELHLDALINTEVIRYKKISKFPQIRRDLSFLVDQSVSASSIESSIRALENSGWLKRFDVFDVYTGQGIPDGKKSLAVAMTLQDDHRTLVDSEINALISAIINTLENKFSILLRD